MDQYHSIIGLPRSGKTTFLAAIWHVLDAGEVQTKLVLDKLVGDTKYMNSIVDAWRQCKAIPRTSMKDEQSVLIHARFKDTAQRIVLGFPDLSGESFERQISARSVKREYAEAYERGGGILLFVSANRANDGVTFSDLGPEILDDGAEKTRAPGAPASAEEPSAVVEWKHSLLPQQVQLVELLQFLQRPPFSRRRRRIVVAISAWDLVEPALSPSEWLQRELPLLAQYLSHNPDAFDYCVCGVSAQGGDLTSHERNALLDKASPSERIRCVGVGVNIHDLTAPIAWLSEVE